MFLVAGAGLFALLLWSFAGLPDFGHYEGPYGDILNDVFDPRAPDDRGGERDQLRLPGFDTLGEEFILFAAVVGVASLLRGLRGERHRALTTRRAGGASGIRASP